MVWPLTLHNVGSGLSREDRGVVHTINCVYMRESNFVTEAHVASSSSTAICLSYLVFSTFVTSRAENAF